MTRVGGERPHIYTFIKHAALKREKKQEKPFSPISLLSFVPRLKNKMLFQPEQGLLHRSLVIVPVMGFALHWLVGKHN